MIISRKTNYNDWRWLWDTYHSIWWDVYNHSMGETLIKDRKKATKDASSFMVENFGVDLSDESCTIQGEKIYHDFKVVDKDKFLLEKMKR